MTTIEVSTTTRDALEALAAHEGLTLNALLERLIRKERRRVVGAELAQQELDDADRDVLGAASGDVLDALG
jgi:hypothetical protein